MTIISHLLEDSGLTHTASGYSLTVGYILQDVPGNGQAMLFNALQDPRIPSFGEAHPVIPRVRVTSRAARAIEDQTIQITIQYGVPDGADRTPVNPQTTPTPEGTISISAAVVSEETQFDRDGNPLKVSYTGTLIADDGNPVEVENEEQVATIEIQRPEMIVSFSRKEDRSPLIQARDAVGRVNSQDIGLYARGTLLLARIDADSDDNGDTFTVQYEFQYRPSGWAQTIVYIDPQTDRPPTDVNKSALGDRFGDRRAANGLAVYDVYPSYDFGSFRLPF